MKKFTYLLLCLCLSFALIGCEETHTGTLSKMNPIPPDEPIQETPVCMIPTYTAYGYDFNHNAIQDIINGVIATYTNDPTSVAYFYEDTYDKESILSNENTIFLAASTYKLPLNMYYYDKIKAKEVQDTTAFAYQKIAYSEGDYISANYKIGATIPLSTLQYYSIVYSDNTASLIMLYHEGVVKTYDAMYQKYAQLHFDDSFYYNNNTTALAGYHIVKYLYEHQKEYPTLLENMKIAMAGQYLQGTTSEYEIAHKYGDYNGYYNDYGIVYTDYPYLVGIYTNQVPNGPDLIAAINDVFLQYTIYKQEKVCK